MAEQIYRGQVKTDRTPSAPDTSLMTYFDKGRRESLKGLGNTVEIEMKRHAKEVQGLKDLTYKQATQVYKNMYEVYKDNPEKYKEGVEKGLKDIFDAVPDGDMKKIVMAEVGITGSGYTAKVKRNLMENNERMANERSREATFAMVGTAQENASELFDALDDSNLPEEREQALQVYMDSAQRAMMAYKRSGAVDRRGNPLFTTSERAALKDQAENFNRYAVLGYAQNNIQNNFQGVVDVYNQMADNKDTFVKEYGLDEKSYTDTMKDVEKIIAGQISPEDAMQASRVMAEIDAEFKEMDLKKGKLTKQNNLTATTALYQKIKEAESQGYNYANRNQIAKKKGALANHVIKLVERGKDASDWNIFQEDVGDVVSRETNSRIADIEDYLVGTGVDVNELKAGMYIDSLGSLQSADSVKLSDAGDTQKTLAKEVTEFAYYKQLNRLVDVNIPDDKRANKLYISNAYKSALKRRQNQQAEYRVYHYMDKAQQAAGK